MGSLANLPGLRAGGTILPRRFVAVSAAADNTGRQASVSTDPIIGVSDESTESPTSANHATSGGTVKLQEGGVVYVEAGAAITRASNVESDANGQAITATVTATGAGVARVQGWVALESASGANVVIRIVRAMNSTAYN